MIRAAYAVEDAEGDPASDVNVLDYWKGFDHAGLFVRSFKAAAKKALDVQLSSSFNDTTRMICSIRICKLKYSKLPFSKTSDGPVMFHILRTMTCQDHSNRTTDILYDVWGGDCTRQRSELSPCLRTKLIEDIASLSP